MSNTKNPKFIELVAKLREIFQIDRPELDFGIYRILNVRAGEINDYLENRLAAKVHVALRSGSDAQRENALRELQEKEEQYQKDGVDPNSVPKVRELRQKLEQYSTGGIEHENAVYSHLLSFFSRYYKDGDFISQRRYKGDTYAIPYAGEEVLLHWANKDQYYTKSGENFSNYSFKLEDGRTVHFRLVAADTAKDNRKDTDKQRRFSLISAKTITRVDDNGDEYEEELIPIEEVDTADGSKDLIIRFEYTAQPAGTKQDKLVENAVKVIEADTIVKARWLTLSNRAPTEKNPQRTLLEKHITDYTSKNTADYFIHKDLGGFLRRELDFYIKNEVMHLDDVQNAGAFADIENNLRMIQCLRVVAQELIEFLAQLEDFQKKLWLKKKFVISSHYCITLDRVPEKLWPEVMANELQWDEWKQLGVWDGSDRESISDLAFSQRRMVDTRLFSSEFKRRLLEEIGDIEKFINGLLIHSDNFHALSLIQTRYRHEVKAVYIDPPYNTGGDGFTYKDRFQQSSWIAMFRDRLAMSIPLLSRDGLIACHMDEHEHMTLEWLMKLLFGSEGDLGKLIWDKRNPKGDARGIAAQHEYVHFAAVDGTHLKESSDSFFRYKENGLAILSKAHQLIKAASGVTEDVRRQFKEWIDRSSFSGGEKAYSLIDDQGQVYQSVSMAWPNKKNAPKDYFVPLDHPITGKPCPVPARGWRNPSKTMKELLASNLILFGNDESTQPRRKYYLHENLTESVPSLYYMGGSDDALLASLGLTFENPKPVKVAMYFLSIIARPNDSLVIDFFAGSGTTAHALINMNRAEQGNGLRKFICVDMSDRFDTVLIPRLKKVTYSAEWLNSAPSAPETGISHCFKVLKLESYEDTLNNLQLRRTPVQAALLDTLPQQVKDDYLLHYMLDVESRGSLLSVEDFRKPFDYTLNIAVDSAGAYEKRKIDMVETFNYLIGLRVKHIDVQPSRGFVTVTGTLPSGESCLVLWRDCDVLDYEGISKLCDRLAINPADNEYDVVYINGDHNIPTVLTQTTEEGGATRVLKLRQIEPEFLERMFSVEDV